MVTFLGQPVAPSQRQGDRLLFYQTPLSRQLLNLNRIDHMLLEPDKQFVQVGIGTIIGWFRMAGCLLAMSGGVIQSQRSVFVEIIKIIEFRTDDVVHPLDIRF